ncbi:putative GTP-binding protein EngB [Dirofilaria immitis]
MMHWKLLQLLFKMQQIYRFFGLSDLTTIKIGMLIQIHHIVWTNARFIVFFSNHLIEMIRTTTIISFF